MSLRLFLTIFFLGFLIINNTNAEEIQVTNNVINGQVENWTKDNTYILNGIIFVEAGGTLNIAEGTVIKGNAGQGENASALVIARGGKINAIGTKSEPIIFTSIADDVNNPNDLPLDQSGLWGGVIILGNARINTTEGEGQIEGIPATEINGKYGGNDDADNSGIFSYVSIRHGGTDIGEGNEINGLTLGAVGSGTQIHHVEVYSNNDDGFEFFGGTVNTKYLVAALCKDDAFDYDEGFRGKGQFWFSIQSSTDGDRAGEHDGGTSPEDGTPFAIPTFSNLTYIGSGVNSNNVDNMTFKIRDNAGGKFYNSVFTEFTGYALDIEDVDGVEVDSKQRLETNDLEFSNNVWFGYGNGASFDDIAKQDYGAAHLKLSNVITDPELMSIGRTNDNSLDPTPKKDSPLWTESKKELNDEWFDNVNFIGAFGTDNWLMDWTFLSEADFLAAPSSVTERLLDDNMMVVRPSLADNYTYINYTLENSSNININLFGIDGKLLMNVFNSYSTLGSHSIKVDLSNIGTGLYFIRLNTEYGFTIKKLIVK